MEELLTRKKGHGRPGGGPGRPELKAKLSAEAWWFVRRYIFIRKNIFEVKMIAGVRINPSRVRFNVYGECRDIQHEAFAVDGMGDEILPRPILTSCDWFICRGTLGDPESSGCVPANVLSPGIGTIDQFGFFTCANPMAPNAPLTYVKVECTVGMVVYIDYSRLLVQGQDQNVLITNIPTIDPMTGNTIGDPLQICLTDDMGNISNVNGTGYAVGVTIVEGPNGFGQNGGVLMNQETQGLGTGSTVPMQPSGCGALPDINFNPVGTYRLQAYITVQAVQDRSFVSDIFTISICPPPKPYQTQPFNSVVIVPTCALCVGKFRRMKALALQDGVPIETQPLFEWISSSPGVAEFISEPIESGLDLVLGKIEGLSPGTTTITATFAGISGMLDLTVVECPDGPPQIVSGVISCCTTWCGTVILDGIVRVLAGGSLQIEPETQVIARGTPSQDPVSALVVERGGTLKVLGDRLRPVEMTVDSGSWLGLIVCGQAPVSAGANSFGQGNLENQIGPVGLPGGSVFGGGNLFQDNSGILRYLEVNSASEGIQLIGVGSSTFIQKVAIRNSGAGWRLWGGTVNPTSILTLNSTFGLDADFGFDGKVNGLAMTQVTNFGARVNYSPGLTEPAPTVLRPSDLLLTNSTLIGQTQSLANIGLVRVSTARLTALNILIGGFGLGLSSVMNNTSTLTLQNVQLSDNIQNLLVGLETFFDAGSQNNRTKPLELRAPYRLPFPDFRPFANAIPQTGWAVSVRNEIEEWLEQV